MKSTRTRNMVVWRCVFAAAGFWTMLGAIPALFDTATAFYRFHGYVARSADILEIYRGSWGQSLLFGIGYLIAALNPERNTTIVLLGAIGKTVYASRFVADVITGQATSFSIAAVIGDFLFVIAFCLFLTTTLPWRRTFGRLGSAE